ncbi:MAG: hypothetical protein RI883_1901 [Bacteroidota bacterium]
MENKNLHIICLDVPFPADYGGVIDMFYRIKALHSLGLNLTLHVFNYGRGEQSELNQFGKVIYYNRKSSFINLFSSRPYIVQTRKNKILLENLLKDDFPILFEGIHTTSYLENSEIQNRTTIVRMHNLEDEYYQGLKKNSSFLKKIFFQQEAIKLKKYQAILSKASFVLAIKDSDSEKIKQINPNIFVLPASIPDIPGKFTKVKRYGLFHGNLSVSENEVAAIWIIEALKNVLDPTFPLIITGKNPSQKLKSLCKKEEIQLIENPDEQTLLQLIQEAQIHVLHTSVPSGIKLKLLSCVHSSGKILVNSHMVAGTSLESFCTIANDAKEFKLHFIGLQTDALTIEEFEERSTFINKHFNNRRNCQIILKLIVGVKKQ